MSSNGNSDGAATSPAPDAPEPATVPQRGLQSSATQDPQHETTPHPPEFLDAHSRHRLSTALAVAGGLVVLLLVATYGAYFLRFGGLPSGDQGTWGQFGDFVGGTLNSLLGLLTLLALVFTVVLQTRQLELSRDELRATRIELKRSATAQREAAEAMKGQLEQARLTAEAQRAASLCALLPRLIEREASSGEHLKHAMSPSTKDALPLISRHHAEMTGLRMKVDQELLRVVSELLRSAGSELSVADGRTTGLHGPDGVAAPGETGQA